MQDMDQFSRAPGYSVTEHGSRHARPVDLAVVILAFNEEAHLPRCLASVGSIARQIIVVDSFSHDRTVQLAEAAGATVLQNRFLNHATQFNWALDNAPITSSWVMRLDADEYVLPELATEIATLLPTLPNDVAGLYVTRRVHFMGKWIKHGGYYPVKLLRIWRAGRARCEERWMDEHIYLMRGRATTLRNDIVDDNRNDITWWTNKHNAYATREAADLLNIRHKLSLRTGVSAEPRGSQAQRKRWLKERVYARLPLGLRALGYFALRYVLLVGFLDGYRGFIFHVLQGLWYRFLVDVKVFEIEEKMRAEGLDARAILARDYGIRID